MIWELVSDGEPGKLELWPATRSDEVRADVESSAPVSEAETEVEELAGVS